MFPAFLEKAHFNECVHDDKVKYKLRTGNVCKIKHGYNIFKHIFTLSACPGQSN